MDERALYGIKSEIHVMHEKASDAMSDDATSDDVVMNARRIVRSASLGTWAHLSFKRVRKFLVLSIGLK